MPRPLIKRILEHPITALLKNFRELIALLIFYVPYFVSIVSGSPLRVDYRAYPLAVPVAAAKALSNGRAGMSREALTQLRTFVSSPQVLQIRIRNLSAKRVTDFELKVNGVIEVSDVGVQTDSSILLRDVENIGQFRKETGKAVTFPNLTYLPPGSTTTLTLWGEFSPAFWSPQIEVQASPWKATISEVGLVSGFTLFVVDNAAPLTGIIIAFLLLVGAKRASKEK